MSDDMRTRIAQALSRAATARGVRLSEDRFAYADAVMDVINEHGPDDLDQFVREQAAASPEFAAAAVQAEHAATVHALEELLADIGLYVHWFDMTKRLTTPQKELWADSIDAAMRRRHEDGGPEPTPMPRWWRDGYVPLSERKTPDA